MCVWRVAICLQVEGSAEAFVEVHAVTAHPGARLKHASSRADVVAFWASKSRETVVADGLDVELDSASVRASVGEATWLAGSAIRPEVSVSNRSSNASASDQESRSVGVDNFNVVSVASVDSSCWIADGEKWASWVESNDRVDAATTNILASQASDVSAQTEANQRRSIKADESVLVQKVKIRSDKLSDSRHSVGGSNVVNRA